MRLRLLLAALVCALGAVPRAEALPVSLAVDAAATGVTLGVSALSSVETASVDVAGSAQADVGIASQPPLGSVPTSLQLASASLTTSDQSFFPALPAGISLTLASTGVGASLSSGVLTGIPVAPGISLVDFAGTVLSLDAGTISAVGAIFAEPVNETFDFGASPLDFVYPLNAIGQAALGPAGALTLRLPIDQAVVLAFPDLDVEVTLGGTLVLVGEVPEPGTLLLFAAGLLAVGLGIGRR